MATNNVSFPFILLPVQSSQHRLKNKGWIMREQSMKNNISASWKLYIPDSQNLQFKNLLVYIQSDKT
jgi:hypothetical protein